MRVSYVLPLMLNHDGQRSTSFCSRSRRMWRVCRKLPSDFEPYGERKREFQPDCSHLPLVPAAPAARTVGLWCLQLVITGITDFHVTFSQ